MNDLFTKIYNNYKNDVYRLIYSYVLNKEDSNDILQKVFTKLFININKFNLVDNNVKKWLFKVASNECKNHLKSYWISKRKYIDDLSNLNKIDNKDNELINILSSISLKYRLPLYLYYYEGYSIKEISTILKISESNTKQRLKRGKEKLKIELEEK